METMSLPGMASFLEPESLPVTRDRWARDRCRTAHDGLVDAALMAEFARRLDAGRLAA